MENAVIRTLDLTKTYGATIAVRKLSLNVLEGQITGFLGRNGAGKSSTIKMLLGMTRPTSGTGTVLGQVIDDPTSNQQMREHVAYVAEDKQMYGYMSVRDMIRFTRSFYDDWDPDLEREFLDRFELPLDRKVRALSKGTRTKLALLLALARRARLLILDEPAEGLDPVAIDELLQTLATAPANGTTVFFSSHQIADVERICDRVCIVDRGELMVDMALDDLRENHRRLLASFDADPPSAALHPHAFGRAARVQASERQLLIDVTHDAASIAERARAFGAVSVTCEPISLRELFLGLVRPEP